MGPLRRGKGGAGGGAGGEGEGRSSSLGQGPPRAGCRGRQGGGEALHNPEPAPRRSLEGRPPRQPYRHRHRHPAKLPRSKSVASFPPAGGRVSPAKNFGDHVVFFWANGMHETLCSSTLAVAGQSQGCRKGKRGGARAVRTGADGEGRSLLLLFSAYLSPYPTPPLFSRNLCFFLVWGGSGDFKGPS